MVDVEIRRDIACVQLEMGRAASQSSMDVRHVSKCALINKLENAEVVVETTEIHSEGTRNGAHAEVSGVAMEVAENQVDVEVGGVPVKVSVSREDVEASKDVECRGNKVGAESKVHVEGFQLQLHEGASVVNTEIADKLVDDDTAGLHSEEEVDSGASKLPAEAAEDNVGSEYPETHVTGKHVGTEATDVPKPLVRRIVAFAETVAKNLENDAKLRLEARGFHVEVPRQNAAVGAPEAHEKGPENQMEVEATKVPSTVRRITALLETSGTLEAEAKLPELPLNIRLALQSSGDPNDGDDLDSAADVETSESEELDSDESDDEDAGDSSSSMGEVPLKDEEIQVLLDQLLKFESEVAEAEEALEEESVATVRDAVRGELSEELSGLELDAAVELEMGAFIEEWQELHDEKLEQCSLLQEKLQDSGVDLPHVYKGIEKQALEGCNTEAWKHRTHWAGHQPTEEVEVVVKRAEEELKRKHPTRSQRGRLVDEGASGFLERKLAAEAEDDGEASTSKSEFIDDDGWSKVDDFLHDDEIPQPGKLMGTKKWAAVYLASTPEQVSQLGISLPGADTVEEIGDMESEKRPQFKAAFANEKERGLTDQQRMSIRKVRDEDDVKRTRRIKKQRRNKLRAKNSLKESRTRLAGVQDISQPNKPVGHHLVVSSNAGPGSVISQLTQSRGSDVIELLSDEEGTRSGAFRDRSAQARATDENEDVMEFCNNAIESGGDLLKHVCNVLAVSKMTHSEGERRTDPNGHSAGYADVTLEENNLSDNSTDIPDAMEEMPSVQVVPPVPELSDVKKKRVHDDDGQPGDGDEQLTPKKCKSVITKNADGISEEDQKQVALVNPDGLKNDAQQHNSPGKTIMYRTTVVIDSDGEREVEEAVAEGVEFESTASRLHHSGSIKRLDTEGQGNGIWLGDVKQQLGRTDLAGYTKKRKWKPAPSKERREFQCTACSERLKKKDVLRHPKLPVGICKHCRKHYLSGPFRKDADGSDCECSWCGEGGEVVCCDKCDKVFCQLCISRNFGSGEAMRIVTSDDWLCYFCNPLPLSNCARELAYAESEARATNSVTLDVGAFGDDSLATIVQEDWRQSKKGKHRKNIRKVLGDDELEEKQKELLALEKERQERLERWRAAAGSNKLSNPSRRKSTVKGVSETAGDDSKDLINVARAENEAPVKIAPSLASVLKGHQLQGVRFMWENCIVSEKWTRDGGEIFGCILAHAMGLGKTLQVITFIHTVLNRKIGLSTALIVVPVNVLHNWRKEFEIWQAGVTEPVPVYMLEESNRENSKRAALLSQWKEDGGVMLIGYNAFRSLALGKHVRDKGTRDELCQALQNPGPDLLVCDEAHIVKNMKADITQVLKQVKTRRRIALTGSPLQNNLMEYYCMVDFVREGFLGSPTVFKNRFSNPIENGQQSDSTNSDVRLMKVRSHVLHKQLKGFVQRMNTSVLKDELPPKCVYVISVRLSPLQRKLYARYLQVRGHLKKEAEETENRHLKKEAEVTESGTLFHAFHALAKIWNHPDLLLIAEEEKKKKQDDFVEGVMPDSDEERFSDSEIGPDAVSKGKAKIPSNRMSKKKNGIELDEPEKPLWWKGMIPENYVRDDLEVSGKMVLVLNLLTMCSRKGDKALVFSQSLGTLGMIETFLERVLSNGAFWERDKHWYRLDGSTPGASRMQMCERFNDPSNTSIKCVLISTKAGSLGINLPAANRVIIVDGSWNPTHDLQALFRAWRIGQEKPVYAYRLVAHGTMEEKIYSRQVQKEGVAARVLDEHQVGRIFAGDDLEFLYKLEEDGDDFVFDENEKSAVIPAGAPGDPLSIGPACVSLATASIGSTSKSKLLAFTLPGDAPPRDDVMGSLLIEYRPRWVVAYHEHEPLLEHREEENLTQEEQAAAWESYKVEGLYNGQFVQNVSTTIMKAANTYTHTVVTKPAVGTSSVRCTPKDHASILAERKVDVKVKIFCDTCLRVISWENLHGQAQQGLIQRSG